MDRTRIVVTGGEGFVGSNIALALKRDRGDCDIVALVHDARTERMENRAGKRH
jgi:nucleoside-diphosphate-sugar epimerase